MEYRKRNLSGSWEEGASASLDDRMEQATKSMCTYICQLAIFAIHGFTNLTRSILGNPRVPDSRSS